MMKFSDLCRECVSGRVFLFPKIEYEWSFGAIQNAKRENHFWVEKNIPHWLFAVDGGEEMGEAQSAF